MTLPRWDRVFFFAFSAASFAALAYMVLLFVPLIEIVNSDGGRVTRRTLLDDDQVLPMVVSLLPVILAGGTLVAIPRHGQPTRSGKINLWLSTILIYFFIAVLILSTGILFVPTAILMTAASVSGQIGRRGPRAREPQESKSGRGGGKRRPG